MAEGEIADITGKIKITWFNQAYLAKMLHEGESVKLTGKITLGKQGIYLANPEFEKTPDLPIDSHDTLFFNKNGTENNIGYSFPIYHETRGLLPSGFIMPLKNLRDKTLDEIADYLPPDILKNIICRP